MLNTTVSGAEEEQAATGVTPPAAADDPAVLKAELELTKGRLAEQERVAGYWYDQRSGPPQQVFQAEPEAEPEPEEEIDMIDLLATKGAKGLDAILAKRGYVRAAEVDQ